MGDVVVTVPKSFGFDTWIAEGDPAGEPWSGTEWDFYLCGPVPAIKPGERVYVTYNGKLRGYAPLVRIDRQGSYRFSLVRHGDAVAVTIPEYIRGFRGFRYVWWDRAIEVPFPDWKLDGERGMALPDETTYKINTGPNGYPGLSTPARQPRTSTKPTWWERQKGKEVNHHD